MSITLSQFADMTVRILEDGGVEEYLPTLVLSLDRSILTLDGVPSDVDQRNALQEWIVKQGNPPEYLFAVRGGDNELTIGRRNGDDYEFLLIYKNGDGFEARSGSKPDWWYLSRN